MMPLLSLDLKRLNGVYRVNREALHGGACKAFRKVQAAGANVVTRSQK